MTEDDLPRSPAAPADPAAPVTTDIPLPGRADDTAADDTAAVDTAAVDTAAVDTAADDTAADDTAADDTAADDTAAVDTAAVDTAPEAEKRRRGRPKGSTSTARTTRVVELTLTVAGGADGEWQAELKQGATWISRGLPVNAASVLRAAQELHPELAEPIETAIGAAREARAARVAALEAELEQARKALAELEA